MHIILVHEYKHILLPSKCHARRRSKFKPRNQKTAFTVARQNTACIAYIIGIHGHGQEVDISWGALMFTSLYILCLFERQDAIPAFRRFSVKNQVATAPATMPVEMRWQQHTALQGFQPIQTSFFGWRCHQCLDIASLCPDLFRNNQDSYLTGSSHGSH